MAQAVADSVPEEETLGEARESKRRKTNALDGQVAVGIVNFKCSPATARCLRSLLAQTEPPIEIVVVDNGSGDGSLEALRAEFARQTSIQFIANSRNVGFAVAQNQAIRATGSEFYLCLNPDAILAPDYVARLVASLRARPAFGYATGLIHFCGSEGEPTDRVFSAGHWWLRNRSALNRYYRLAWPEDRIESGEVGGASGCAALYRRAMLEAIDLGGGEFFDETYFLYMEDVDLDWRAHLAGWRCWFEASARALHEGEVTGGGKDGRIFGQLTGNRWLMILKNDTLGNFLRHLPYILKADLQFFWPELLSRPGGLKGFLQGLGDRIREALNKRPAVRRSANVSNAEIREWMRMSLEDVRKFNARRREQG